MLRTMKRFTALSFGIALPVDTQRTRFTWPRPCLLRPWFLRLTVMLLRTAGRGRAGQLPV